MQRVQQLIFIAGVISWLVSTSAALAADIWYEDNNLGKPGGMPADFVSKFNSPESFRQATDAIDVYLMRANVLNKLDDNFVGKVFSSYLVKNHIKLAVNDGGATWMQRPGRKKVSKNNIDLYNRLKRLGITVDYVSLQSVLSKIPKEDGVKVDYPLAKRVEDIVIYARAITEIYPKAEIGIIDALPSHGKEYRQPYRDLRDALSRAGLKLSFIHLDMPFEIPREQQRGITWQTVRDVERYVEDELGLVFGYFTTSRKGGDTSSKAYHRSVIADLDCYAGSGGTPDDYIIASWFPYPEKTIPEFATGDEYPTMRTVVEFGRKLEQIEQGGSTWNVQRAKEQGWRVQCGISNSKN